ncbi:helix-turn-helix transcriptional regulator [Actinoplanes sp. NPDC023801]|uniref:helix-turn-helix transcriptional regulator n=1 Tax=Actinoplanes sp. NPDC023801 TaxID=3154595 RepID=UPI00340762F5
MAFLLRYAAPEPAGGVLPIRVGVRQLTPVVTDGVRGWLRCDPRLLPVGPGDGTDVVVLDPHGGPPGLVGDVCRSGNRVVAFAPAGNSCRAGVGATGPCPTGADACVGQDQGRLALIAAILTVTGADGAAAHAAPRLSGRERTALVWWLRSLTKASVARRMGISPHTVDMYIKRVRAKYAAAGWLLPTKADLLARAVEDGLVGPEDLLEIRRPGPVSR